MNDITDENKMQDKIEKIGKTVIQHGKINNRVFLMKFSPDDAPTIASDAEKLAAENGYTKVIAKIHSESFPFFVTKGYHAEAFVPKFYNNTEDCLMVAKFLDKTRNKIPSDELGKFKRLLNNGIKKNGKNNPEQDVYQIHNLYEGDAEQISEILKRVFKTYPFPVHDPSYIIKTMKYDGTRYYGVKDGDKLVGVSTAEVDKINRNAEMTDFAVLPEYRGQKLAYRLLKKMEEEMKADNIFTVYTIARLKEPGMNKTFLNSGYKYTGTLVNNTNISGSIESMNVLYKHL